MNLTHQLRRWQSRERSYRFAWGFARWGAIVLALLAACCFTDWIIDRSTDTPFALRAAMTFVQAVAAFVLGYWLLTRLQVPHIDELAGQAEAAIPEFDHRLVTSLQLNRAGADTRGMSKQLLDAVTVEAESLSARHNLASLADGKRLEHAAMLLIPVVMVAVAFAVLRPTLTTALLQRQVLMDVMIPRSVQVENITPDLLPAGDAVRLLFAVKGDFTESSTGRVVVEPDGMSREVYELKFDSKRDGDTAVFVAEVPPSSTDFAFRAKLHDGRTRTENRVRFAARPVVTETNAWLVLPSYVDPKGTTRFERFQPQGEVTTLPDSGLHMEAAFSKPVASANLVVFSRPDGKAEVEILRVPMTLTREQTRGDARLDTIPPHAVAYRITAVDDHGFANTNPPRRGIASGGYKAPNVKLLMEVMGGPRDEGPMEDRAVDGLPLVLGGKVQLGWNARSPLGISKALIWYRVNPTNRENDAWTPLPLKPLQGDVSKRGAFLPEWGLFANDDYEANVEFFAIPAGDASEPPGLEAGGRYNFETAALTKVLTDGKTAKLEVGDTVEFLVVAYDRNPEPGRAPGESPSRVKAVVSDKQLDEWITQLGQSRGRLEELFKKQRRVFTPEKP